MSAAACTVLLTPLLAPSLGSDTPDDCFAAGLDMAGRIEQRFPAGGIDRQLTLPRARTGLGLEQQGIGGRVILGTVRSGGTGSYVGVDGEALVPRVEIAEARATLPGAGVSLAAGLIDDPWVATGNIAWGLRSVAAEMSQDQGWNDRSDLGALASFTAPSSWVTVAASMTTGEGLARRERNNGQNLSVLLVGRPLASLADDPDQLALTVYYRDGSRGLGLVQDHRLGVRLTGFVGPVYAGAEHLRATGVQGNGSLTPSGTSLWAASQPSVPVAAFARVDLVDQSPDATEDTQTVFLGGAGVRLPWSADGAPPPGRLMVVFEQRSAAAGATELAGSVAGQSASMVGLQLDVNLWGAVSTTALDPNTRSVTAD